MSMHPTITAALAEQHRRDLTPPRRDLPDRPRRPPGARTSGADHPEPDRGSAAAGHPPVPAEGPRDRRSRQSPLTQAVTVRNIS